MLRAWTLALGALLWHGAAMRNNAPMAGGFFLILPIIIGFVWGLSIGRAREATLAGFVVGLVLLLIVALLDRRRSR